MLGKGSAPSYLPFLLIVLVALASVPIAHLAPSDQSVVVTNGTTITAATSHGTLTSTAESPNPPTTEIVTTLTTTSNRNTNASLSIRPIATPLGHDWRNGTVAAQAGYPQYTFFTGRMYNSPVSSVTNSMSSSFVAPTNTIAGIQSSDRVAVLPLNLAYGTASGCYGYTCYLWFQFAISFNYGGSTDFVLEINTCCDLFGQMSYGSPSNGREWGTSVSPPQNIPLSYTVGHKYHVDLRPTASNQVSFTLSDDTVALYWAVQVSNMPSTTVLINPSVPNGGGTAFSPAATIEGLVATSVTSISNFPYMDVDVFEDMQNTVILSGANPCSGCPTGSPAGEYDNIAEIMPTEWRWAVLPMSNSGLSNNGPVPSLTVSYSSSAFAGSPMTIDLAAQDIGSAADFMKVQISFPSSTSAITPLSTGDSWSISAPAVYGPGSTFEVNYGFRYLGVSSTTQLSYALVEGSSNWAAGETKHLRVSVNVSTPGDFVFQVKTVASYSGRPINWVPVFTNSPPGYQSCPGSLYNICRDQQSEYVAQFHISVASYFVCTYVDPNNIGGSFTLNGIPYSDGQRAPVLADGTTYNLAAASVSNYLFDHWSSVRSVYMTNTGQSSTTVWFDASGWDGWCLGDLSLSYAKIQTATRTITSTETSTSYSYGTRTTTVTSYTSTSTLTSTIPTVTTVVLVPLTITSTEHSTQFLTSFLTTTVTSYTGTTTSTSTIPTTVALVPLTVTATAQSTQYLTSILTTTVTSYTSTETSTSTMVVYTTVTELGTGAAASSPLAYLGFLSLFAITVGCSITSKEGWRIPKLRSRPERRCKSN